MTKSKPKPKKTVIIVGGGIGGLTAAHELIERGFNVKIYEGDRIFGGKAACEFQDENLVRDHSIKNFPAYYNCLFETLKRIPFEDEEVQVQEGDDQKKKSKKKEKQKTVFDNLASIPTLRSVLPDKSVFTINTSLNLGLLEKYREFKKFGETLKTQGVSEEQFNGYVKKHARLLWICEKRKLKELESISYIDYLGFDPKTQPETRVLLSLVEIISAAKVDGNALAAADQCLKIFGRFFNPHKLKYTANLLNGPIQTKFLDPWVKHLQNLGVETFTEKLLKKVNVDEKDPKKITSFEFHDGEVVTGDYFILGLNYSKLKVLINECNLSEQFKTIPALKTEGGEKWGHTCHFALKEMPSGVEKTTVHAVLGSPWSVIYYYVTDDIWKTGKYPSKEAPVQLWVTASDCKAPGVLYKKGYENCTEEEFKNEILAQVNFKDEDKHLIIDSVVGRGLGWYNKKTFQFERDTAVQRSAAYSDQLIAGERTRPVNEDLEIVCESPLYSRDISMDQFPTETFFSNMVLAGEIVQTKQMISTMEKANEGGKRAANAICVKENKKYPKKKFDYDPLPLKFLRNIDSFFFTLFG